MIVFITFVLAMAAFQSFSKLSLLPRKWEFPLAAGLFALPFLFESRIARTSMLTLNSDLSSASVLENWCALVVIQELFTLTVGFSLLDDLAGNGKPKPAGFWKYLVFLPSVLLPAGVLCLQMYLFNILPGIKFRTLTWLLAAGLLMAVFLIPEMIRLLRRDPEARILTVLHAEYFLVLPAIFLPVAANARLVSRESDVALTDSLLLLAGLSGLVLFSGTGCKLYEIYKRNQRKKKKCPL